MKKCLFGLAMFLSISLCGCNNGSDGQPIGENTGIIENTANHKEESQNSAAAEDILPYISADMSVSELATVDDAQRDIYNSQQDNISVSELTGKTEVFEVESLEMTPELKELMFGNMGNLDLGTLAYTVSDRDDEDYRLYFFQSGNEEDKYLSFDKMSFNLSEASFVFPDLREGNVPIGKFKEIYFMDYTDISKDGSADVIVIAVYEKDGNEYYNTRVYEEREKGFVVNVALTQELNEKYYNVKDYPVWDILTAPGE